MQSRARSTVVIVLAGISLLMSALVFNGVVDVALTPNPDLVARYSGSAREDIFGFGVWFNLTLLAIVQLIVSTGGWYATRGSRRLRVLFSVLFVVFAMSLVGEYWSEKHLSRVLTAKGEANAV